MILDWAAIMAAVSGACVAATQSFAACSAAASARPIAALSSWDRSARYPPTAAPAAKTSSPAQTPTTQPAPGAADADRPCALAGLLGPAQAIRVRWLGRFGPL